MEPLSTAASIAGQIVLGVGTNELHRQLVKSLQRTDADALSLQRALHRSLLTAVDTLATALSAETHPYFLAIQDPDLRRQERQRVKGIFATIRGRFPQTGSFQQAVPFVVEQGAALNVDELLAGLGLSDEVASLPDPLRNLFCNNLPLATLLAFRRQAATDERIGTLLQLDVTTDGFQTVRRELKAIDTFMRAQFGTQDPAQIKRWTENAAADLKEFITQTVAETVLALKQLLRDNLPYAGIFCPIDVDAGERTIDRYLILRATGKLFLPDKLVEDFSEKITRTGSVLLRGLPGTGKTVTGLALAQSLHHQQQPYTVLYANLQDGVDINDIAVGLRQHLTQPAIFFFDDCQGKLQKMDALKRRLRRSIRQSGQRAYLVFATRSVPTPAGTGMSYSASGC